MNDFTCCCICFNKDIETVHILCGHTVCMDCFGKWAPICEKKRTEMACPECLNGTLNRPSTSQPDCIEPPSEPDYNEPDSLFNEWLRKNKCRRCPSCGCWIQKQTGCKSVECIHCNQSFQWPTGTKHPLGNEDFYENPVDEWKDQELIRENMETFYKTERIGRRLGYFKHLCLDEYNKYFLDSRERFKQRMNRIVPECVTIQKNGKKCETKVAPGCQVCRTHTK